MRCTPPGADSATRRAARRDAELAEDERAAASDEDASATFREAFGIADPGEDFHAEIAAALAVLLFGEVIDET